jgi:hypothetical protein
MHQESSNSTYIRVINNRKLRFRRKLKGQFFLWGALLIVIALFVGSTSFTQRVVVTEADDMSFYSENIRKEIPKAFNLGLNRSDAIDTMSDFSRFLDTMLADKFIEYSSLWLVSEKNGTGLNITVGNFMDKDVTMVLNISSVSKNLFIPSNSTNWTTFDSVDPTFELKINYNSINKTLNWWRDKVNLYVYFNLTREKRKVLEDIVA